MITRDEILMGREKEYPLTMELAINLADFMGSINYIRGRYGRPLSTSSGYRPGHYNKDAGGAKDSTHLYCLASDSSDHKKVIREIDGKKYLIGEFANWCLDNLKELEIAGLFMEDPRYTDGWVHLQKRTPPSLKRVFIPSATARMMRPI